MKGEKMKYCRKCGGKLDNGVCLRCGHHENQHQPPKRKLLRWIIVVGIFLVVGGLGYRTYVHKKFETTYAQLYRDSQKQIPNNQYTQREIRKLQTSLWTFSKAKREDYQKQLAIVEQKISLRTQLNALFESKIPENGTKGLVIASTVQQTLPTFEVTDAFYKQMEQVKTYYETEFASYTRNIEAINTIDMNRVSFDEIQSLQDSIETVNDRTLQKDLVAKAQNIVHIKTTFDDYFTSHVGTHFSMNDQMNGIKTVYQFDYPNDGFEIGGYQGLSLKGNMSSISYNAAEDTYYLYTPLTSFDGSIAFDGFLLPLQIKDGQLLTQYQLSVYDPQHTQLDAIFMKKQDPKTVFTFDQQPQTVLSTQKEAATNFAHFKSLFEIPKGAMDIPTTETKEYYELNLLEDSPYGLTTHRIGTAQLYQDGRIYYKES